MDDSIFDAPFPDAIEAILNEEVAAALEDAASVTSTSATSVGDQSMTEERDDQLGPILEPFRGRCSTWPRRQPQPVNLLADLQQQLQQSSTGSEALPQVNEEADGSSTSGFSTPLTGMDSPCGSPKQKSGSRRNPWGNLSYADLITQAIKSSPEHRLTLAQIYEWLVKNIPYFKDKGDSTSSSGWKVRESQNSKEYYIMNKWCLCSV